MGRDDYRSCEGLADARPGKFMPSSWFGKEGGGPPTPKGGNRGRAEDGVSGAVLWAFDWRWGGL
jgi:hypothetical protein